MPENIYITSDVLNYDNIEKMPLVILKNMVKKRKYFCPSIKLSNVENIEKFSKKLISLYKYAIKSGIALYDANGNLAIVNIENTSEENMGLFKKLLYSLSFTNIKESYEYIYDDTINYLNEKFTQNDYCKFENDMCICQRETKKVVSPKDGCCHTFHYRKFDGMPVHEGKCKELMPGGGCNVNSMACKMYTCKYLKNKGVSFGCKDFFLLKIWLNKKQRAYLESCFFIRREKNIEKLIELK